MDHVESVVLRGTGDRSLAEADDAVAGLRNHPPRGWPNVEHAPYEPIALLTDRQRLETFYKHRGFFSVKVGKPVVERTPRGTVRVRYDVNPGAQFLVSGVVHDEFPPEVDIRIKDGLAVGTFFDLELYEQTKASLRKALVDAGYLFSKIYGRVVIDHAGRQTLVKLRAIAGPAVRVADITVEGFDGPDTFVLARLRLQPGDLLQRQALEESRGAIISTGLIRSVRFLWDRHTPKKKVRLRVVCEPAPRHSIGVSLGGARADGVWKVRNRTTYTLRGWPDPVMTFGAELRPSLSFFDDAVAPSIEILASLTREDTLAPRLRAELGALFGLHQYEAFRTHGASIFFVLTRPFVGDRLLAGLRTQLSIFDLAHDFEIQDSDAFRLGFYDPSRTIAWSPFMTLDLRDDAQSPTKGGFGAVELTFGLNPDAEKLGYLGLRIDVRGYIPLGTERVVLAGRGRVSAYLWNPSSVPIFERYFLGGATSHRGFADRALSPRTPTTDGETAPVGGTAGVETSVELRIRIWKLFGQWLGAVLFADAGEVGATLADLRWQEPHVAAGGGVRFGTPIGPLRLDFGHRLNRRDELRGDFAVHLSLGEAF